MTTALDRHRVLGGPTRSRLLAVLRAAARPLTIRELADAVGLHPNSAREQLRVLADVGLVAIEAAPPAGRGRPAFRYTTSSVTAEAQPYRALARVLADEVARRPDAAAMASAAGERWGREVAAADADPTTDPVDRLVRVLDEAGFVPDPVAAGDDEVRLRACPFEPIEQRLLPVVCGVHLGFVEGVLAGSGSSLAAAGIEPYVEPGLCVTRLAARDEAGGTGVSRQQNPREATDA